MKVIFLVLLIIPVAFVQLVILADIINTSHKLRKAKSVKTYSSSHEDERKELLYKAN